MLISVINRLVVGTIATETPCLDPLERERDQAKQRTENH